MVESGLQWQPAGNPLRVIVVVMIRVVSPGSPDTGLTANLIRLEAQSVVIGDCGVEKSKQLDVHKQLIV